jgi:hypothetical protein
MKSKRDPVLVELDLVKLTTRIIGTPGLLVGQPSFLGIDIVVFAIPKSQVKRHGVKFCLNRLNGVYKISGDEITCITTLYSNARSPRVVDGEVYFLTVDNGTPHFSASRLVKVSDEGPGKIIVDIDCDPKFPGIFLDILPSNSEWGGFLYCTSTVKTYNRIIRIELKTGKVTVLHHGMFVVLINRFFIFMGRLVCRIRIHRCQTIKLEIAF